ncbi:TIGR03088 family PEP-CTERM/XrtA system glycosyltransferase [Rhodanobacter ginsengisoli]|uniref:TIGR03088 family PEP-CTERM/XrtA system glycosyltransferase n=1 Tax=Rhodanobacter ginsengisoli TaxID=418646 RepID=A0ABW0QI52_9GAMM
MNGKPLIAHVLYRLETGGMERVLVTMINRTQLQYRHAVICLDGFSALREQIEDTNVPCLALNKRPGKDWPCYFRLWKALRKLKPDLVHSYNFGALDAAPVAKLAGVRHIVHAERGRNASDPRGESRKYRNLRRWLLPFIDRYLTVSRDLQDWLTEKVGIDPSRVVFIPNGIDPANYVIAPRKNEVRPILSSFAPPGTIVIGSVGRLDPVKDQAGLVSAFNLLCESLPDVRERLRLVIVGEGPQRSMLEAQITDLGLSEQVYLLGNRNDVPAILPEFDIFALSSIAEGMPGVLLEAMAAGLPVAATEVGGVSEVVSSGVTGLLVAASSPHALAKALANYVSNEALRSRHGHAGRARVEAGFSLNEMVSAYTALYDELLHGGPARPHSKPASELTERKEH